MIIKYYKAKAQHLFGKDRYYIVGDPKKAVGTLTGKSTVDDADLLALEALGLSVREVTNIDEI